MKIISMAWTEHAYTAGRKTVTRRDWKDEYASRHKKGEILQVYNRSPRFGGKKIGYLRITEIYKQHMKFMPDSDYESEGFKYMEEQELIIWAKTPKQAFEGWRNEDREMWVVRFNKIDQLSQNHGVIQCQ